MKVRYELYTKENQISNNYFSQIWSILEESFDIDELRTKEECISLLNHPKFKILIAIESSIVYGVLFLWETDNFYFIENLAIKKDQRNRGIGSNLLNYLKESSKKQIILEIEPILNVESIQARRWHFYQRIGFKKNHHDYTMPAIRENTTPMKLTILSYPQLIEDDDFPIINDTILTIIYEGKKL